MAGRALLIQIRELNSEVPQIERAVVRVQVLKAMLLVVVLGTGGSAIFAQRPPDDHCSAHKLLRGTWAEVVQSGQGLKAIPKAAIRSSNLRWELPISAATGVLIAEVDQPAANRIQSPSLQHTADLWSNIGLGIEIASGAFTHGLGCGERRSYLSDTGFKILAGMGVTGTADLVLKLAFNRQYPFTPGSTGKFWGGGKSFPSGHSATSFAFAAIMADRYPRKKWIKWGAYGLATGVALSRYPAKRHYTSDILVGATVGYATGVYLSEH
jgi:hypothetical protein